MRQYFDYNHEWDSKELELCMTELFGISDWNMGDKKQPEFLSTDGQVIIYKGREQPAEVRQLKLNENRDHNTIIMRTIALYLTRHIKDINLWNDLMDEVMKYQTTKNPTLNKHRYPGYRISNTSEKFYAKKNNWGFLHHDGQLYFEKNDMQIEFLNFTKSCRVAVRKEGNVVIDLNIQSFHHLTSSQRRFFLDYIEFHHISPDKVFIDDHSKEQKIKRQLGVDISYQIGDKVE